MRTSIAGKSTRAGRQGFTLFELLVVIAILAVVAGLVVPSIDMNVRATGPEAVQEFLRGVLGECRTHARLTRKDVTISFKERSLSWTGEKGTFDYPDDAKFQGIVFAGSADELETDLTVNRLGVTAAAIVRFTAEGKTYSFRISPVVREIRIQQGLARFDDFAD